MRNKAPNQAKGVLDMLARKLRKERRGCEGEDGELVVHEDPLNQFNKMVPRGLR